MPLGYGVIGSPTGSGPVSLGSSPGTPASDNADASQCARVLLSASAPGAPARPRPARPSSIPVCPALNVSVTQSSPLESDKSSARACRLRNRHAWRRLESRTGPLSAGWRSAWAGASAGRRPSASAGLAASVGCWPLAGADRWESARADCSESARADRLRPAQRVARSGPDQERRHPPDSQPRTATDSECRSAAWLA